MRRIIHFEIGKDETRSKLHIYIGNFVFVHREIARERKKRRGRRWYEKRKRKRDREEGRVRERAVVKPDKK